MESSAANRRKQVSRTLARVFAGWRTALPGPVIILQAGNAVNYFGTGLPWRLRMESSASAGRVASTVLDRRHRGRR